MDLEELDRNITAAQVDLDVELKALEDSRKEFREAVLEFSDVWMKKEFQDHLFAEHPERAETLGPDEVAAMRKDVEALRKRIPRLIDKAIGENERWPHREEFTERMGRIQDLCRQSGDFLVNMIRDVVSPFGTILRKYDLLPFDGRGEWEPTGEGLLYCHGFRMTPRLKKAIERYDERFRGYDEAREKVARLQEQRVQEEEKVIWEDKQ